MEVDDNYTDGGAIDSNDKNTTSDSESENESDQDVSKERVSSSD